MKILVTAKNGQLGWELQRVFQEGSFLDKKWHSILSVRFCDSKELDITDTASIQAVFLDFKPDLVINAAAYTAVDKAESNMKAAYAVNEGGVINLARECKKTGTKLIHISTDFVFSAEKNTPYKPHDQTNPLNTYGSSKLAGELAAQEILGEDAYIVRTAWVYSIHGNNFVKTMIRLMQEKEHLSIVADQIGTPTSANLLAKTLWHLAMYSFSNKTKNQIYHWTDLGTASWYDFAIAIQELSLEQGIIKKSIPITPISSSEYPTPAIRPSYSMMDTSLLRDVLGIPGIHWRKALSPIIQELAKS